MKARKATPAKKKRSTSRKGKPTAANSKRQKQSAGTSPKDEKKIKSFPIVGIGGSAGGLEAFSNFLEHLPTDLGMAYIYIQHLSPSHESFLPQILQRKTRMPVIR